MRQSWETAFVVVVVHLVTRKAEIVVVCVQGYHLTKLTFDYDQTKKTLLRGKYERCVYYSILIRVFMIQIIRKYQS